ncbi:MurR/RpiR family transcriptional regulator [Breznakiella homolactica]|uniref:MurR/RpiR family transcriptional regulator n=1 Tax=Breznakiella homolactica TaxID=2798577 RepID=A0A7T8BAI3_9SPIR|nr:MurR/RpiR family transcriptional regulator [Breznakiella homolactica]QQO09542.1 MurR/RpiR family transcriptional regulator [Breznakiella homolactica]
MIRNDMNYSLDVIIQIGGAINTFSKTEKKIAQFIMDKPSEALALSITDLAKTCNVSEATVFRFCKTLNLNGYQELRVELMKAISKRQNPEKLEDAAIEDRDSLQVLAKKVMHLQQEALERAYNALDFKALEKAITLIDRAEKVYFFGTGNSFLNAMIAKTQFMDVSHKFHVEQDIYAQAYAASLLPKGTAAVFFSYSGATQCTVEVAKLAKAAGAKIIAITRFIRSPLTEYCDVVIQCGVNEAPNQQGSLSVKVGTMYLLDIIFTDYIRRNQSAVTRNREISGHAVFDRIPTKTKKKKKEEP